MYACNTCLFRITMSNSGSSFLWLGFIKVQLKGGETFIDETTNAGLVWADDRWRAQFAATSEQARPLRRAGRLLDF